MIMMVRGCFSDTELISLAEVGMNNEGCLMIWSLEHEKVKRKWICCGEGVLFFKRGPFLFSWQTKSPHWHLLFFLRMEARGHRFEMHRYLTLVDRHNIHNYQFVTDIILEVPTAVDLVLCAIVLLVREAEFCTLKRGWVVKKTEVVGSIQEKLLLWSSPPCFPLPLNST